MMLVELLLQLLILCDFAKCLSCTWENESVQYVNHDLQAYHLSCIGVLRIRRKPNYSFANIHTCSDRLLQYCRDTFWIKHPSKSMISNMENISTFSITQQTCPHDPYIESLPTLLLQLHAAVICLVSLPLLFSQPLQLQLVVEMTTCVYTLPQTLLFTSENVLLIMIMYVNLCAIYITIPTPRSILPV